MEKIGNQMKEKPWIKSKTQFAASAIENEIKKMENEQNSNVLRLIRNYYHDKQIYYAGQGITSFEDFVSKVVLNKDLGNTIKKIEKESKKSNKKIEELEKDKRRIDKLEDALNTLMFIANGKDWGYSDVDMDKLWKQFNPKFHEILADAKKSGSKNL